MAAQFSIRVDSFMSSMQEIVQIAATHGVKDLRKVATYTELAKEVCDLEVKNEKISKALEANKDGENVRSFEEAYQTDISKKSRNKNSKRYVEFQKYAKQMLKAPTASSTQQGGSIQVGDDMVFDDFVSPLDPITKKPIVHPMKNKRCGHHYEKESILEMISTNRHLRCPVAGCGDKEPITRSNLVDDPEFARLLEEQQRLEEESD